MTDKEKLKKIKELVDSYHRLLYTDYSDGEYRILFYKMTEDMKKLIDA